MITVGMNNEPNRVNLIEQTLKKIPENSRILDAGAGEQQFKKFCSHLNYVSQDFAQYTGQGDNKALQTGSWNVSKLDIISDITNIPEPDSSFDAILCTEVLEHLPNPVLAVREFSRLLHSNGFLILTAPFCSLTHFSPYHFYTGFNRYFYETHLRDNNLKIIDLQTNGNFFEYLAQEVHRIPSIASQYTNQKINLLDRIGLKIILKMLQKFSSEDSNSHELLNFGYHILAQKM
jgi:2-polyprenyl-3-methyl-5-hydroxy-6-metoxy-1,4-benzoquinol methylase